jgi:hypothetical protein
VSCHFVDDCMFHIGISFVEFFFIYNLLFIYYNDFLMLLAYTKPPHMKSLLQPEVATRKTSFGVPSLSSNNPHLTRHNRYSEDSDITPTTLNNHNIQANQEEDDLPPPSLDDLPGFQTSSSLVSAYDDDGVNEDPDEPADEDGDFYKQLENLGTFPYCAFYPPFNFFL